MTQTNGIDIKVEIASAIKNGITTKHVNQEKLREDL